MTTQTFASCSDQTAQTGTLFVVATPIGNLADITTRAQACLQAVDLIACEDTRTSVKLLKYYNISTKLVAYHDHNADSQTALLLEKLQAGQNIALISDAGTPLISDPGFRLVQACHDVGVRVSPIVGASAAVAALSVAGLPSDKFYFYGFLPAKTHARQHELAAFLYAPYTVIFYETPHRIIASLADMVNVLGANRVATLCRELTKTFETIKRAPLDRLLAFVENDANQQKGEMVLLLAPSPKAAQAENAHDELLQKLLAYLPTKQAVALASELTGAKKNALYDRALILKGASSR